MLLFADAHCCALLREEALIVCLSTPPNAIMVSSGWIAVEESNELLRELMKILVAYPKLTKHKLRFDE